MAHDDELVASLRAATELLESVNGDRTLLDALTADERIRLVNAAGDVFCPDVEDRRQLAKSRRKAARAEKLQRDEDVLGDTGIRRLRAKAVFTTPNVFPPEGFAQQEVSDEDADGTVFREVIEAQHCYICKTKYDKVHHFCNCARGRGSRWPWHQRISVCIGR